MGYYRMSFEAFNNLVEELTPFVQSQCVNLFQPQVETRKIVVIMIYRLVHGISATHNVDWFNVGTSTIMKYVDIMSGAPCDKNKLFNKFISNPSGANSSLGGITKNHLKEWLKNQKESNHFLRHFTLNVFTTIIFFFSCLSIACTNILLEVYFGIKKLELKKIIFNQNGPFKN